MTKRCGWCGDDPLYVEYHDTEWGVPLHDDRKLFEMLILEGAQAGLSWITILRKREAYRKAFDRFDPKKIVDYKAPKLRELMNNAGIVRNKLKIEGTVKNAKAFLAVQKEFGSFDAYIWQLVGGAPIVNHLKAGERLPPTTPESDAMSKALKKRGFTFVGSTGTAPHSNASSLTSEFAGFGPSTRLSSSVTPTNPRIASR